MIINGILETELIFPTDIDETLITYNNINPNEAIEMNYYGQKKTVMPLKNNIAFLRAMKARGYYIIAWSGNGYGWVKEVVTKLGLDDVVDLRMSKFSKCLDDKKIGSWAKTIYVPENT